MKKRVHTDSALDEPDSCPQIELSERNKLLDKMGSKLSNSWRGGGGGCFNESTSTVFQYPYSEWIPNSIYHADYSVRMKTFEKWPKQMRPLPEELAECGFFYKGYGDSVECFFCGVCLYRWETEDNPIIEHRKWSPFCKFSNMISHF